MLALYLERLEETDDKAFLTQLYVTYERVMYAAALSLLGSPASAEDAVHDSFLKVIRHLPRCRDIPEERRGAWLVMIVKNTAIDMLRREKRTVPLESRGEPADTADGIGEWTAAADIQALLRQLPMAQRVTLSLKYLEGWTDREVAGMLGISERTVRSRVFQARKLLKQRMEEMA